MGPSTPPGAAAVGVGVSLLGICASEPASPSKPTRENANQTVAPSRLPPRRIAHDNTPRSGDAGGPRNRSIRTEPWNQPQHPRVDPCGWSARAASFVQIAGRQASCARSRHTVLGGGTCCCAFAPQSRKAVGTTRRGRGRTAPIHPGCPRALKRVGGRAMRPACCWACRPLAPKPPGQASPRASRVPAGGAQAHHSDCHSPLTDIHCIHHTHTPLHRSLGQHRHPSAAAASAETRGRRQLAKSRARRAYAPLLIGGPTACP